MADDKQLTYRPVTSTHPGEIVVDYLEFNGWSQRDLARRTGLTPKTISEICSGKASISPATAVALESVLKRPAHFWLNLQGRFDESEARSDARAKFSQWTSWAKKFPIKALKQFEWIEPSGSRDSDVANLLHFLGVSSPESWNAVWNATNVAYRQTRNEMASVESISAWVRAAELVAEQMASKDFNQDSLKGMLPRLRALTRKRAEIGTAEMQTLCADAGLVVIILPELPRTGISGCARWISERKPFIGLTLRYRWDDQFWFTFFHEVGHILLHGKKHRFILDNAVEQLTDSVVDPQMQKYEEEANRFAADTLIPPPALFEFIQKRDFSNGSIHDFSEAQNVGPGIVVGRLQREGLLEYHQGNALKQKLSPGVTWASSDAEK